MSDKRPIVLCVGGHDPTGGAGVQADIETVTALGGRAVTVITCLTAQDTRNVVAVWPTPPEQLTRQAETLLADIQPQAVKLGLLGSTNAVLAVSRLLEALDVPVVMDPVLAAGGGRPLADEAFRDTYSARLLPRCTLLTPNRSEAAGLTGREDPDEAAETLLDRGTRAVLVTGADLAAERRDAEVINRLYRPDTEVRSWSWPRLPATYHGSGCTLASACALALARGEPIEAAVDAAQGFTWQALQAAEAVGQAQTLPWRGR
jgi:hydroxymethylpyrimidine/phosphomethylpyrimidine kinase